MELFDIHDFLDSSSDFSDPKVVVEAVAGIYPNIEYVSELDALHTNQYDIQSNETYSEATQFISNVSDEEDVDIETVDDSSVVTEETKSFVEPAADSILPPSFGLVEEECIETEIIHLPSMPMTIHGSVSVSGVHNVPSLAEVPGSVGGSNTAGMPGSTEIPDVAAFEEEVEKLLSELGGIEAEDMASLIDQFERQDSNSTVNEETMPLLAPSTSTAGSTSSSSKIIYTDFPAISTQSPLPNLSQPIESAESASCDAIGTKIPVTPSTKTNSLNRPSKQIIHITLPREKPQVIANQSLISSKLTSSQIPTQPFTISAKPKSAPVSLLKKNSGNLPTKTLERNNSEVFKRTKADANVHKTKGPSVLVSHQQQKSHVMAVPRKSLPANSLNCNSNQLIDFSSKTTHSSNSTDLVMKNRNTKVKEILSQGVTTKIIEIKSSPNASKYTKVIESGSVAQTLKVEDATSNLKAKKQASDQPLTNHKKVDSTKTLELSRSFTDTPHAKAAYQLQHSTPEMVLNKLPDYISAQSNGRSAISTNQVKSVAAKSLLCDRLNLVKEIKKSPDSTQKFERKSQREIPHKKRHQKLKRQNERANGCDAQDLNLSSQKHDIERHSPLDKTHRHRSRYKKRAGQRSVSSASSDDTDDSNSPISRSWSDSMSRSNSRSHSKSRPTSQSRPSSQSGLNSVSKRRRSQTPPLSPAPNFINDGENLMDSSMKRRRSSSTSSSEWSSSSRSRSRSCDETWKRKRRKTSYNGDSGSDSRSSSPVRSANQAKSEAHDKAMAERRVVYVGGIPRKYTPSDLRKRFDGFGEIEDASVHFRHNSDNYGFVTYFCTEHAQKAIEDGNKVSGPNFNLCFGGRRLFCKTDYADLDGCTAVKEEWAIHEVGRQDPADDFDLLLKQTLNKIKR